MVLPRRQYREKDIEGKLERQQRLEHNKKRMWNTRGSKVTHNNMRLVSYTDTWANTIQKKTQKDKVHMEIPEDINSTHSILQQKPRRDRPPHACRVPMDVAELKLGFNHHVIQRARLAVPKQIKVIIVIIIRSSSSSSSLPSSQYHCHLHRH